MRIRRRDGRSHRGERRDGRAWDDTRAADNLSDREACRRGDRDIILSVVTARSGESGRRSREEVRGRRGVLKVEGECALVDDRAAREGILAEDREVTLARLDQRACAGDEGSRGDGDVTISVDLDGAVAGEDDVQATLGSRIDPGECQVGEGVKVMQYARARGREVQITNREDVRVATRARDGADIEVARAEVVVGNALRSHGRSQIASENQGAEATHAALLVDRARIDARGRAGGLRIREAED